MKCMVCKHAEPRTGEVIVTLERGGRILVVKRVPAGASAQIAVRSTLTRQ